MKWPQWFGYTYLDGAPQLRFLAPGREDLVVIRNNPNIGNFVEPFPAGSRDEAMDILKEKLRLKEVK